jgi:hypothetical protein
LKVGICGGVLVTCSLKDSGGECGCLDIGARRASDGNFGGRLLPGDLCAVAAAGADHKDRFVEEGLDGETGIFEAVSFGHTEG